MTQQELRDLLNKRININFQEIEGKNYVMLSIGSFYIYKEEIEVDKIKSNFIENTINSIEDLEANTINNIIDNLIINNVNTK